MLHFPNSKILKLISIYSVYTAFMGVGRREAVPLPWVFIHDTNQVEGSLMVLFFGLVFFPLLPPPEIFLPTSNVLNCVT